MKPGIIASITRHESTPGNSRWESSFADSAARIEATRDLTLNAGRDVHNLGGVLESRGDLQISADRDVTLAAMEERHNTSRGNHYLNSQTTQLSSEARAGGNLSIQASRGLTAIASGATAGSTVAAGWANATILGVLAGAAGGASSAVIQGQNWRDAALIGSVTGGFAGYLSAGTYFDNPINTVGNIKKYIGSGEWMSLGKEVSKVGMNQAFGYAQAKVAKEVGLKPHELNWLLMAGSILGSQLESVGSRLVDQDDGFFKTNKTGIKGVGNRVNALTGLPFDVMDIVLGYQGLPDASVQEYLSLLGTDNVLSSGHSLGALSNIYLAANGLTDKVYLYSIPFGAVAPANAESMIGSWDFVNGGWLGKIFNWGAKVVPLKPWEHGFDYYKKHIKD